MQDGTLFTEDFLLQGVQQTADWQEFKDADLKTIEAGLKAIFAPFSVGANHNEADTEERVIYKVLDALGWEGLILRRNTMAAKGSATQEGLERRARRKQAVAVEKRANRVRRDGEVGECSWAAT